MPIVRRFIPVFTALLLLVPRVASAQAVGAAANAGAPPSTAVSATPPVTVAAGKPSGPAGIPAAGASTTGASAAAKAPAPPPPEAAAVDLHEPFKQSFFFTPEDLISIHKAIEAQVAVEHGGKFGQTGSNAAQQVIIPPVRRIKLSAVIYKDPQNWMVWLNGQKVTPTVSLAEIMDIKVEKDLVHLKWFDIGANKVLVLTMRPNETYDIVTGILLPGAG